VIGWVAGVAVVLLAALVATRSLLRPPQPSPRGGTERALTGTVFYRERIALPPNSKAEVVLEDVSVADRPAVEIARATIAPAGQVPIPFELRYVASNIEKDHRYGVRAAILWPSGARMFVSTAHSPAFASADNLEILVQRVSESSESAENTRRMLYECGGDVYFAMRIGANQATLTSPKFLGNDSIVLPQTEAESGARYAAGDTVFVSKGDVATFQIGGRTFIDCRAARSTR
jgi:putative lipoprotein